MIMKKFKRLYSSALAKMCDFSTLPPHIVTDVLYHLNIVDFCNAVQTCKAWYYASCDPKIVNKLRARVPFDAVNVDFLVRPIGTLRLDHPNLNKFRYRDLFHNFGQTIIELDLFVQISMPRLFELFIYLTNVHTLKLYDGSKFISSLNFDRCRRIAKHRETIRDNIGNIKYLTIQVSSQNLELYKIFLNYCTNIEKLYWYGSGVLRINQSEFMNGFLLNPNESRLLRNTTHLVIRSVDELHKIFESLTNLKLTKLRILNLSEISLNYYDLMFKNFCRTYNNLEKYGMNACNNQHLQDICQYMKKLETLEIENCSAESSLCGIKNLPQLEYLHIERRDPVIDNYLIQLMNYGMHNLKSLSLNKIGAELLNAICANCLGLDTLILLWMYTKDCEPIFRSLVKLRKLHLSFSESVRCHSSRIVSSAVYNITKLTKLKDLYVSSYVPGITPQLIKQLPHVDLKFMEDVFDPTEEDLARWAYNAQELHAHQNMGQQTDDDTNSILDLSEFGDFLTLLHNVE